MAFNTPVLFLIFNRPDTTKQVFEKIREIQPKYLYVAADGPRTNKEGEKELCAATRNIVLENIDWDCEVKTLLREENLGCGKAVSSAITWFFENVPQGIILEDDILTDFSFFNFCEELLDYYKSDEQVFSITGSNFQDGKKRGNSSYYFSRYSYVWGWATWKRAWEKYDFEMSQLQNFKVKNKISKIFDDKQEQDFWIKQFENAKSIDTWDYQWTFALWDNNGITITPNTNLTKNIGFGPDATHTTSSNPRISKFELKSINKIKYIKEILVNVEADKYTFYNYYSPIVTKKTLFNRLLKKLVNYKNKIIQK